MVSRPRPRGGRPRALPRLVRYCRADVASLISLAEVVVDRLADQGMADPQAGWVRPAWERVCLLNRRGGRPAGKGWQPERGMEHMPCVLLV